MDLEISETVGYMSCLASELQPIYIQQNAYLNKVAPINLKQRTT
jgi:hypothetical protein